MDKTAATTVMGNCISWSKFDSIRKQALCDEVKKTDGTDTHNPPKEHGCKPEALCVDKENLLQEAQSWSPTQNINWSELARRYGLNKKNGGQCIKEYLKQHNIPSAFLDQTPNRNQRRRRKTLPGGIPFPMHKPSEKSACSKTENTATVNARKIRLVDIQMKLLAKHERMGLKGSVHVFRVSCRLLAGNVPHIHLGRCTSVRYHALLPW